MELVYNVEVKTYSIKVADNNGIGLSSPELVFNCLKRDFNPMQEEMYLLTVDSQNKVIEKTLLAKGGTNVLYLAPSDIFRHVLLTASNRFVIAHNHPSGDTSPSEEDITFTGKVVKACKVMGLTLLDHVVYTSDKYYSFKAQGLIV